MSENGKTNIAPQAGENITVWRGLDWFRYTVPHDTPKETLVPDGKLKYDLYEHKKRAYPGYTNTIPLYPAGRADWHRDRPEQRLMLTLTGGDLWSLRQMGYTDDQILRAAYRHPDAAYTRIDYAIDVHNSGITAKDLAEDAEEGRIKTSAKKIGTVTSKSEGLPPGTTLYIGSRQSAIFVRCYDKGIEQKTGEDWLRIEVELKKHAAERFVDLWAERGLHVAGSAMLRAFVVFENETIDAIIGGEGTILKGDKKRLGNREKWLRDTILPLLAKELRGGNLWLRDALVATLTEQGILCNVNA